MLSEVVDEGMAAVSDALGDLDPSKLKDAYIVQDAVEAAMRRAIQKGCRQRPVIVGIVVPEKG